MVSPAAVNRYQDSEIRKARSRRQAALFKARVAGGARCAEHRGQDRYTVTGRGGDRYTVHVFGLGVEHVRCDCKAGSFGQPCWHGACAWLRAVADRAAAQLAEAA